MYNVYKVYEAGILGLSRTCAMQAATTGVKRFVEISDARMKPSDKVSL